MPCARELEEAGRLAEGQSDTAFYEASQLAGGAADVVQGTDAIPGRVYAVGPGKQVLGVKGRAGVLFGNSHIFIVRYHS